MFEVLLVTGNIFPEISKLDTSTLPNALSGLNSIPVPAVFTATNLSALPVYVLGVSESCKKF